MKFKSFFAQARNHVCISAYIWPGKGMQSEVLTLALAVASSNRYITCIQGQREIGGHITDGRVISLSTTLGHDNNIRPNC